MSAAGTIAARYELRREGFSLDVDVEIPMRGITGIFGESGTGKTSLLRCIAGLEDAATGRLVVAGEVWQDGKSGRPIHERNIGYVFQEPRLFRHLDVRGNLEYGQRRTQGCDIDVDDVVGLLGLGGLLGRWPDTLSGGEAQRVAIARALLRAPRFVLMDEPLASLDRARRDEILPFLDRLHANLELPIIYVSHSIDEVTRLCDHLLVMDGGRIVANGGLQQVLLQTDLPGLGGEEAGAVIQARVAGYDDNYDLTRVVFNGGEMWISGRHDADIELRLRIRANDVSLCRERPSETTILNVLPGTIESIHADSDASELVYLALGNERILARVTRRSRTELGLQCGDQVMAQIKSVAVDRKRRIASNAAIKVLQIITVPAAPETAGEAAWPAAIPKAAHATTSGKTRS
jgi:molybdate transport system ATP-binding protein